MRTWILIACLVACGAPQRAAEPAPVRVLFIGNSLTFYNDMPKHFAEYVASAYGRRVITEMIAPPGESLAGHRKTGRALAAIRAQPWSFVVLQDRGTGTWRLDDRTLALPPEPYVDDVGVFAAAAKARGATPILYETWGADTLVPATTYGTALAARTSGATIAPIGHAFRRAGLATMVGDDHIHPSPRGSQLIAVTLAQTMFGPPRVASPDSELADAALAELAAAGAPPRPEYTAQPVVGAAEPLTLAAITGVWRARRGGTRLSAGTEILVDAGTVRVREYVPSERIELPVTNVRVDAGVLRFTVAQANITFDFELALATATLGGYSLRGPDRARPIYRSVHFERDGDAAYFGTLAELYRQREADEAAHGLAQALPPHYARLTAFVGEPAMAQLLEGAPLDEWMQILAAWLHTDEPARALAYYRVAVELHPASLDAHLQLADALAQTGATADARATYLRAKALPGAADPQIVQQITEALAALK
ncbi:MAG: bacterial transcriptional activator domain-containing protein [Kofleriaceae bacterium]